MSEATILKNSVYDSKNIFDGRNSLIGSELDNFNIGSSKRNDLNSIERTDLDSSKRTDLDSRRSSRRSRRRNNTNNHPKTESDVCPICGSRNLLNDDVHFEIVCGDCGVVLEESMIDSSPSGTSINREGQNLTQNGAPKNIALHDGGMSTTFNLKDSPIVDRSKWYRLRRLQSQSRVRGPRERNLSKAFNELASLGSHLSLPKNVRDEAASIYRKAVDKDLIRGRSIHMVLSATLYAACRRCNVPRTLDEVAEVANISKKSLAKTYRFLSRELKLKLNPTSPVDYIPRFASSLNLSGQVEVKSIEIINEAKDLGLIASKSPTGVAAAALYCSSILLGERRTQSQIAKVVGVTEVTIRNRYKELCEGIDLYN